MSQIQEMYNRFRTQIEDEHGIKISRLEVTDNNGVVTIKVVPKLEEKQITFATADGGGQEPDDIIVDDGDGDGVIIIDWGTIVGGFSIKNNAPVNVYRSDNGTIFSKINSEPVMLPYTDTVPASGEYWYYVVPVVNGKEGIPSKIKNIYVEVNPE